jgi:hypothetical protein
MLVVARIYFSTNSLGFFSTSISLQTSVLEMTTCLCGSIKEQLRIFGETKRLLLSWKKSD